MHPECQAAVKKACSLIEGLGCTVEPEYPARLNDLIPDGFGVVMNVLLANRIDYWERQFGESILEELEPMTAKMVERGRGFLGMQYHQGLEQVAAYSREVCSWWDKGFDVLITPTMPEPPARLGEMSPEGDPIPVLKRMAQITRFASPFNLTGQPAISLPLHIAENGLPVGVQFVAKYGREDLLLRLAFALESSGFNPAKSLLELS